MALICVTGVSGRVGSSLVPRLQRAGHDVRCVVRSRERLPVMAHLGAWGRRHLPVTRELAVRAELLERGGPQLWDEF
ncbi:NAD-dependent epimerase/dehydratase family protein, partial [Amycolatopsis sp. 3B14]|uniref:NAD-dependent epimerase/dehydratase family protein n=1 Tax=Amycolatopsis sp. 3B14 TaxID=3243600 RepID=UPI003D98C767